MNKADVDEMKLELLRVAAICATQRKCLGCPAHGGYDYGCFFDNCKLPHVIAVILGQIFGGAA